MLMYAIARMRLPAEELINKIANAFLANSENLDVKDVIILFWAYARLDYYRSPSWVKDRLCNKFHKNLVNYIFKNADETYLDEQNPILAEI